MADQMCWEFKKCERQVGGAKTAELGQCPAAPANGRDCWAVAGTLCGGKVQGTEAEKMGNCRECDFYRGVMMGEF